MAAALHQLPPAQLGCSEPPLASDSLQEAESTSSPCPSSKLPAWKSKAALTLTPEKSKLRERHGAEGGVPRTQGWGERSK